MIIKQISEALKGVDVSIDKHLIIAYEPVWAISSSGSAIRAEAEEVSYTTDVIRQILLDMYGNEKVNSCFNIIYGGSVDSNNVTDYISLPNISGVLVGSASLKAEEFVKLINSV